MPRPIDTCVPLACLAIGSFVVAGCAYTKSPAVLAQESKLLAPVQPPARPNALILRDFGRMIVAYTGGQSAPIVIEIELIGNDTGLQKELPRDIAYYLDEVLAEMGAGIRTTRTYPSIVTLDSPAAGGWPFVPQPDKPTPTVKVRGQLLRASDAVEKEYEMRADVAASIRGGDGDGAAKKDGRRTLTVIRVGLQLVDPSGVSAGPCATYDLLLFRKEGTVSISAYYNGSGVGVGGGVKVAQNVGDAIYDITGTCLIQLLGYWMTVPYHRVNPAVFPADERLEQCLRTALDGDSRTGIEQRIKRYLFAAGSAMDMNGPALTVCDRAIIRTEMSRFALSPDSLQDEVAFAIALWRDLDYRAGARRVEQQVARNARAIREGAESALAAQQVEQAQQFAHKVEMRGRTEGRPAVRFGWPAGTPTIVLDLSRVSDAAARKAALQVIGAAPGLEEIKAEGSTPRYGLRYSGTPADLQWALRRCGSLAGFEYVWDDGRTTLAVVSRR